MSKGQRDFGGSLSFLSSGGFFLSFLGRWTTSRCGGGSAGRALRRRSVARRLGSLRRGCRTTFLTRSRLLTGLRGPCRLLGPGLWSFRHTSGLLRPGLHSGGGSGARAGCCGLACGGGSGTRAGCLAAKEKASPFPDWLSMSKGQRDFGGSLSFLSSGGFFLSFWGAGRLSRCGGGSAGRACGGGALRGGSARCGGGAGRLSSRGAGC